MATEQALTKKQEAFARAVAQGKTQSDAYRAAYSAKKMPDNQVWVRASELMANSKVTVRVADLSQKGAEKAELSIAMVLKEAMRLAFFDPRKLLDADGKLKPIKDLDDDTAAAIAAFEVEEGKDGKIKSKYKVVDKNPALERLFKHLGMFEADNKQKHPIQEMDENMLAAFVARKAKEAGIVLH